MEDCLFCKIINQEIHSDIVHQDDLVTVFKDINPAAPVHLLLVPNKHVPSVIEMEEGDEDILGKLFSTAKKVAEDLNINKSGYRLIINNGPDGRQEIHHLHMHLLGGAKMKHPMG